MPRITATSAAATRPSAKCARRSLRAPADRARRSRFRSSGRRPYPEHWTSCPVGIEVGERRYHRREGNEQRNKHQHNQAGHRGAVMHKAATRVLPEATPSTSSFSLKFSSASLFSYLTSWRTPASVANLRIDNGVQHVNDGVEQDSQGANEDRQAEHQRVVAVKRPLTNSWPIPAGRKWFQ